MTAGQIVLRLSCSVVFKSFVLAFCDVSLAVFAVAAFFLPQGLRPNCRVTDLTMLEYGVLL